MSHSPRQRAPVGAFHRRGQGRRRHRPVQQSCRRLWLPKGPPRASTYRQTIRRPWSLGLHNPLRFGPVRDPIKSLIECGVGDDVATVIVNGEICMENGIIPGIDLVNLGNQVQAVGEQIWASFLNWDPQGRTAEQACPWSFSLHREAPAESGARG